MTHTVTNATVPAIGDRLTRWSRGLAETATLVPGRPRLGNYMLCITSSATLTIQSEARGQGSWDVLYPTMLRLAAGQHRDCDNAD